MSGRRVVVTGIGSLTPLGDRPRDVHRSLCAGASGLGPLTAIDGEGLGALEAGELANFDAATHLGRRGLRGMDRSSRLTSAAAALALADGGRLADGVAETADTGDGEVGDSEIGEIGEIGLVLGTMLSGVRTTSGFDRRAVTAGPSYAKPMDFANTVINAAAGQAAIRLGLRGINATVASGLASSCQAIGYAVDLIRTGRAGALLAGGMDELSWEALLAFRGSGLLAGNGNGASRYPIPCDRRRNGFALGEAAAFLLLEDADSAGARGARILAEVRGHGTAYVSPRRRDPGAEVARSVRAALTDAELEPEAIDAISLSANGSPDGDLAEARGLRAVFGEGLATLPLTAPKAALGDSLGASGAVAAALMITSWSESTLPGVVGFEEPDPDLAYPTLSAVPRPMIGGRSLVCSRGLEGKSSAVILEPPASGARPVA